MKRQLLSIAALLSLLIAIIALGPSLRAKLDKSVDRPLLSQQSLSCDLSQRCEFSIGAQTPLNFSILPQTLSHEQDLQISLSKVPSSVTGVEMRFFSEVMEMGMQRFKLLPQGTEATAATQDYSALSRITYCSIDTNMLWTAQIDISTPQGSHRVSIDLPPRSSEP